MLISFDSRIREAKRERERKRERGRERERRGMTNWKRVE